MYACMYVYVCTGHGREPAMPRTGRHFGTLVVVPRPWVQQFVADTARKVSSPRRDSRTMPFKNDEVEHLVAADAARHEQSKESKVVHRGIAWQ